MLAMQSEESKEFTPRIAAELRAEVARQQISPVDFAQRVGISPETMRKKLRGQAPLTIEELATFARALRSRPSKFVEQAEVQAS